MPIRRFSQYHQHEAVELGKNDTLDTVTDLALDIGAVRTLVLVYDPENSLEQWLDTDGLRDYLERRRQS